MRCRVLMLVTAALLAAGCKKSGKEPGVSSHGLTGAGVSVSNGIAADLRATQDRLFITFLTDSMKPRVDGIPPQMLVGVLQALPVNGGAARKLGTGVTNLPGGYLTSPDSRWALYLEGFNAASHSGVLHAVDLKDPSSDPVRLDADVTYLLPSPDSATIAYVKNGILKVGSLPKGPFREVAGEVTTAQFSPDSAYLAFRRSPSAAGGLGLVKAAGNEALKKLSDQVGDYIFSPDSKRVAFAVRSTTTPGTFDLHVAAVADAKASKVANGSSGFAFSPDGKWLARTEGSRSVEAVNFVGDVVVGPATGVGGAKVASSASGTGFSFSPDSTKLAALEKFDFSKGREWGNLVYVDLKDAKPKELAKRVKTFLWAPDSQSLAFQPIDFHQEFGISANLMVYKPSFEAPKQVMTGAWGYSFDPKSRYLLARNNCSRVGAGTAPRACDLHSIDLGQDALPMKKLVEGMFSFKPAADGNKVLLTYAEIGPDTFNVATYDVQSGERKTLDQHILLPALFVGENSDQVAYVVAERRRAGVYLAPTSGGAGTAQAKPSRQ